MYHCQSLLLLATHWRVHLEGEIRQLKDSRAKCKAVEQSAEGLRQLSWQVGTADRPVHKIALTDQAAAAARGVSERCDAWQEDLQSRLTSSIAVNEELLSMVEAIDLKKLEQLEHRKLRTLKGEQK